eukprot:g3279.t1
MAAAGGNSNLTEKLEELVCQEMSTYEGLVLAPSTNAGDEKQKRILSFIKQAAIRDVESLMLPSASSFSQLVTCLSAVCGTSPLMFQSSLCGLAHIIAPKASFVQRASSWSTCPSLYCLIVAGSGEGKSVVCAPLECAAELFARLVTAVDVPEPDGGEGKQPVIINIGHDYTTAAAQAAAANKHSPGEVAIADEIKDLYNRAGEPMIEHKSLPVANHHLPAWNPDSGRQISRVDRQRVKVEGKGFSTIYYTQSRNMLDFCVAANGCGLGSGGLLARFLVTFVCPSATIMDPTSGVLLSVKDKDAAAGINHRLGAPFREALRGGGNKETVAAAAAAAAEAIEEVRSASADDDEEDKEEVPLTDLENSDVWRQVQKELRSTSIIDMKFIMTGFLILGKVVMRDLNEVTMAPGLALEVFSKYWSLQRANGTEFSSSHPIYAAGASRAPEKVARLSAAFVINNRVAKVLGEVLTNPILLGLLSDTIRVLKDDEADDETITVNFNKLGDALSNRGGLIAPSRLVIRHSELATARLNVAHSSLFPLLACGELTPSGAAQSLARVSEISSSFSPYTASSVWAATSLLAGTKGIVDIDIVKSLRKVVTSAGGATSITKKRREVGLKVLGQMARTGLAVILFSKKMHPPRSYSMILIPPPPKAGPQTDAGKAATAAADAAVAAAFPGDLLAQAQAQNQAAVDDVCRGSVQNVVNNHDLFIVAMNEAFSGACSFVDFKKVSESISYSDKTHKKDAFALDAALVDSCKESVEDLMNKPYLFNDHLDLSKCKGDGIQRLVLASHRTVARPEVALIGAEALKANVQTMLRLLKEYPGKFDFVFVDPELVPLTTLEDVQKQKKEWIACKIAMMAERRDLRPWQVDQLPEVAAKWKVYQAARSKYHAALAQSAGSAAAAKAGAPLEEHDPLIIGGHVFERNEAHDEEEVHGPWHLSGEREYLMSVDACPAGTRFEVLEQAGGYITVRLLDHVGTAGDEPAKTDFRVTLHQFYAMFDETHFHMAANADGQRFQKSIFPVRTAEGDVQADQEDKAEAAGSEIPGDDSGGGGGGGGGGTQIDGIVAGAAGGQQQQVAASNKKQQKRKDRDHSADDDDDDEEEEEESANKKSKAAGEAAEKGDSDDGMIDLDSE